MAESGKQAFDGPAVFRLPLQMVCRFFGKIEWSLPGFRLIFLKFRLY